jgi:hypothetical protein
MAQMSRWRGLFLFAIFSLLFLIVNRAAYKGYFQDDEMNNLSWTPAVALKDYAVGAITPRFQPNNFRPVGHFYFYAAERFFHLDFRGYVAVLHLIHLLNVWLLWLAARKLGASVLAAGVGCAFFGFHMALFDVFWKPMYVFDLLCGTLSLTSLLLYTRQQWVLSFAAFWLAYKAKELAVMLPIVLAFYELWLGERRWKPLVPFFLASLSFGLQGVLLNPNSDNEYTFRFTPAALAKTVPFYVGRLFLVPYAGLAVVAAAFDRNRRTWFGLAMMLCTFIPLLFLPGRMFSAYCYLPLAGLAIALTGLAESAKSPVWLAAFFLAWIPIDYHELRARRSETLAHDTEIKTWVTTVAAFLQTAPAVDSWVYSGEPSGFQPWGIEGTLKYLLRTNVLDLHSLQDPEASASIQRGSAAVLRWHPEAKTLEISAPPLN